MYVEGNGPLMASDLSLVVQQVGGTQLSSRQRGCVCCISPSAEVCLVRVSVIRILFLFLSTTKYMPVQESVPSGFR